MSLQADKHEDWVIATGKTTTVRDFVKLAFKEIGVTWRLEGMGKDEKAFIATCSNSKYNLKIGKEVLAVDPRYFRPTEVELLIGDATKAKEKLGWTPQIQLPELVKDMMQSDLQLMQKDQYLKEGGYTIKN